jgi:hypothetical protein
VSDDKKIVSSYVHEVVFRANTTYGISNRQLLLAATLEGVAGVMFYPAAT